MSGPRLPVVDPNTTPGAPGASRGELAAPRPRRCPGLLQAFTVA